MMFRANENLVLYVPTPVKYTTTNGNPILFAYETTPANLTCLIYEGRGNQIASFAVSSTPPAGITITAGGNVDYFLVTIAPSVLAANPLGGGDWQVCLISSASPYLFIPGRASAYWGGAYETMCAGVASLLTRLGTPITGTVASNVEGVKTDTSNLVTRVGTPTGGTTVSSNVEAVKTKTDNLPPNTATTLGTLATSAALSFAQGDITTIKTATNSTNLATPLSGIKAKTDLIGASVASQTDTNNIYNRIGAPAGGISISNDITAVKTDTGNTVSRLGTPTPGNTVAAVVEATKTDTGNTVSRLGTPLTGTLATNIEGVAAKTNNLPIDTAALLGVPDSGTMSDVIDAIKAKLSGGGEIYDWLQMVSWVNGALDGSVLGSYDDAVGQFTLVQGATVLLTVQYYSDKEGTVIHVGPMGTAASRKVLP